jgi:hypothetical protein
MTNPQTALDAMAFRAPAFRSSPAPGHLDALPIHQCIGNFFPGFMQVAPRSLTGDSQFCGCFFLFEPFKIDQTNQFNLFRF